MSTTATEPQTARSGPEAHDSPKFRHEKQDVESSDPDEKTELGETIATADADADDYPHGLTLFFLILALSLGTLMMALDNACRQINQNPTLHDADWPPDDCSDRCPENHRRIPRSRRCCLVRVGLLHDRRRLPAHVGKGVQVLSSQDRLHDRLFHLRARQPR